MAYVTEVPMKAARLMPAASARRATSITASVSGRLASGASTAAASSGRASGFISKRKRHGSTCGTSGCLPATRESKMP